MTEAHDVRDAELSGTTLTMIVDGRQYRFDMAQGSQQRENFEVSPSGYGIHWPDLDEDLSIDGLLGVVHAPENQTATTAADRRRS